MIAALTPSRVETGFWMILWVGLAAGIGLETKWGRQMQWPLPTIADTPAAFSKPELAEAFRLPPPDHFSQVTARPIFIVTRRPSPVAPPPEPPKPSMKKDQFILMGTTVAGASKIAFLIEKAGNASRVVAEGKEINGITVREIAADRVVLSQFGDTEVLVLRTNKPRPGVPGIPAAGQPAVPFFGAPAKPPGAQVPFFGAPGGVPPPGAQGVPPFPGAPAIPPGAPGARPFPGFPPGTPPGAQGAPQPSSPPGTPPGAPGAGVTPDAAPPGGRRGNPAFPGTPFGIPKQ